jgi:mRNA-degrading endonuclease RelE of RelBE toxin-antitoxin system
MAWKIELSAQVDRELGKLDPQQTKRILKFLHEQVADWTIREVSDRRCGVQNSGNFGNTASVTIAYSARSKTTGCLFWCCASAIAEKSTADLFSAFPPHALRLRE